MHRFSKKSIERLEGINPILLNILLEGIKDSPFDFGIPKDGGMRTLKRQQELYAKGRTTEKLRDKGITDIEGKPNAKKITWTLNSYHRSGNAFDLFAVPPTGGASWDRKYLEPIARHLQKVASENYGIILNWGYDLWKKDAAHFQID